MIPIRQVALTILRANFTVKIGISLASPISILDSIQTVSTVAKFDIAVSNVTVVWLKDFEGSQIFDNLREIIDIKSAKLCYAYIVHYAKHPSRAEGYSVYREGMYTGITLWHWESFKVTPILNSGRQRMFGVFSTWILTRCVELPYNQVRKVCIEISIEHNHIFW